MQNPDDAEFPDMPAATRETVSGGSVRPAPAIADEIAKQIGRPVPPPAEAPESMMLELKIAGLDGARISTEDQLGTLSPYNCPDCNGVLWEVHNSPMFRCHTGYA